MTKLGKSLDKTFKKRENSLNSEFAKVGPLKVNKSEGKRNLRLEKSFDKLEDQLHVPHKERD
jgi:hypothetical protein